jgi:hypothetical protein
MCLSEALGSFAMSRNKITEDQWRDILNRLVLRPRLKAAARAAGIDASTLFAKIKASIENPDDHKLVWLDKLDTFANHVTLARKLSIVELDRAALTLGLEGHSQPRYHEGRPVYVRDPEIEADALTLDEFDWIEKYGINRRRDDTYLRRDGKLVQEMVTSPPNAQLVSKLLSSLIPEYSERSEVTHTHQGSVWIEGQTTPAQLSSSSSRDNLLGFGAAPSEQQQRPSNTLAAPRPCANSADFDARFRKKLLREVVLFRDSDGKLLPPLPGPDGDVVVAGTIQARAFEDEGIPVTLVHPTVLLDEGFENQWLRDLAPAWKPKPKPKSAPPTEQEREAVAVKAAAKIVEREQPGKASARRDSENIGKPNYGRNGFRVVR